MATVLGAPVPDNLEQMSLEEIHALHSSFWNERTLLKQKMMSIMPVLQAKQLQRDIQTRAGFDTVISQGRAPGLNVSVETAKEMLEAAKTGAMNFGKDMLARLKQIAGGQ